MRLFAVLVSMVTGCASGIKLQHVLGYAPDGRHVVVSEDEASIALYDLATRKFIWKQGLQGDPAKFVRFSPGGGVFVVYGSEYGKRGTARYSIWKASSGQRLSQSFKGFGADIDARVPDELAVSEDGRWVANGVEDDRRLRIRAAVDRREAFQGPEDGVLWLSFAPGGSRLGACLVRLAMVLEESGGGWRTVASLPEAEDCRWIGRRLAYTTAHTVEIWDGDATRVLRKMSAGQLLGLDDDRLLVQSKDGGHTEVIDVATGRSVFAKEHLGITKDAVLRDGHLLLLVWRDEKHKGLVADSDESHAWLLDFALDTGQLVREEDLGAASSRYTNNTPIYTPAGSSIHPHFLPYLLPGGRYVDLVDEDVHRFRPIP